MKRIKREPYFILTKVDLPNGLTPIMCTFCRFSEWKGCCEDAECDCLHPLDRVDRRTRKIEEMIDNVMTGSDCFLFRPAFAPDIAADIVGIWLQGKEPDWDTVPRVGRSK